MKYLIISLSMLFINTVNAQKTFDISEHTTFINGNYTEAISLDMKAGKDEAKKAWNNYIQDEHGIDMKGYGFFQKKDKQKTAPLPIAFLSDEKLILYTSFNGDEMHTVMDIYVLKANGTSLSLENDSMVINNLEILTEEFVANFLPHYYEERVDNANKEYEDSMNELSKIKNEITENSLKLKKLKQKEEELKKRRITAINKIGSRKNSLLKKTIVYEKLKKKTADFK